MTFEKYSNFYSSFFFDILMPRSSSDEDYKTNHGQSKKNLFESEEFSIFKDSTALFSENQKKPQPSRIDSQRPYHSTSSTKSTLLLHKNKILLGQFQI